MVPRTTETLFQPVWKPIPGPTFVGGPPLGSSRSTPMKWSQISLSQGPEWLLHQLPDVVHGEGRRMSEPKSESQGLPRRRVGDRRRAPTDRTADDGRGVTGGSVVTRALT